jgi:CBS domain-containing protein
MPMQTIREVMTPRVVTLPSETTLAEAARTMREQDIGDIVVSDNGGIAGLVTDRDIVVRAVAER